MNVRAASAGAESAPEGRAITAISDAFHRLEASIYPSDARAFRSTTLQQVKDVAKIIERDQAKRRCLRNLRRIKPFFEALARFGGSIETLCQGTPFLCFIWAPVKLLLTIADEYTSGFEKLVEAYSQIAQNLPRFDRLSDAFKEQPDFQAILADVYADLLEFHFHAYKFLRRSGWKHLWEASWRGFSSRFNTILQNMNRSQDLVDKEATSFEILEAKSMRERLLAALEQNEAQKREWQLRDSLAWLDLQGHDREQDDLLERCATSRQQGTCEWFLRHTKIVAWLDEEDQCNTLWLKGKPGAGKTTLAAYLLQAAPMSPQASVFYCLCPDRLTHPGRNVCGLIFRSLVAQLIRVKSEVLPFVYETFVKLGATPSLPKVRDLLRTLLRSPGITYIIFDGLDECESADQTHVLSELQNLLKPDARTKDEKLKVLICSRETKEISRKLNQTLRISLSDEQQNMSRDISKFTEFSLAELSDRFSTEIINEVSGEVVKKADGMFLWVRLVLSMLLDQESISDLREAVHRLPIGLESAYGSILNRIQAQMDESQRVRAKAILSWLAFAYRPLQSFELCDALIFSEKRVLDEQTKLGKGVLDICKPLIEEREGHVFALVHFSAREYLLSQKSGPFLSSLQAQSDITRTCLRYLATCRIFLVEPASTIARQQIVKELHSLFPYVNEYLLRHMLALIKFSQTQQNSLVITSMIQGAVDVLSAFARVQAPAQTSFKPSTVENVELAGLSKEMFASLPTTLRQYLQFRERVASLPGNQGVSKHTSDQDPTFLSQSYRCYRAAFEHLLSDSAIQDCAGIGVESKDIKRFQEIYRISGYLCSFPGCRRGFLGFPSAPDRNNHESFHSPQFRCVELDCDFSKLGFNSRQALRKHRLKYHTSVNEVPLPRFGHRQPTSLDGKRATELQKRLRGQSDGGDRNQKEKISRAPRAPRDSVGPSNDLLDLDEKLASVNDWRSEAKSILRTASTSEQIEALLETGRSFLTTMPELTDLESLYHVRKWTEDAVAAQENIKSQSLGQCKAILDRAKELAIPPTQPEVAFFNEMVRQGDFWEQKAKEIMTTGIMHYPQLDALHSQVEKVQFPVNPETLAQMDAILTKNREAHRKIVTFYEKSQDPDFRKRPLYTDIREVMKTLEDLNSKPQGAIDLERELRRHEDWMRKGKKLFGRANAPLNILEVHMKSVEEKNNFCFDLNDTFRPLVEPASREISPNKDLEKGEILVENEKPVFCICRQPERGMMIMCENCREWYHNKCLKIARGKMKKFDAFTCPICDWRVKIPRDAARPKLEDLQYWADEIPNLPFQPEEEDILKRIVSKAQAFRDFLQQFTNGNQICRTSEEMPTMLFYLRKLEGADVLLAYETNSFRQELHKWQPIAPEPPPVLQQGLSTRKPRPTKLQKTMKEMGVEKVEDLPPHLRTKTIVKRKSTDPSINDAPRPPPLQPAHSSEVVRL